MAEDSFRDDRAGLDLPATIAQSVTPSDATEFDKYTRAISVQVAGNIRVDMMGNGDQTFAVPAGIIPIRVKRVYSTSTTATGIAAYW